MQNMIHLTGVTHLVLKCFLFFQLQQLLSFAFNPAQVFLVAIGYSYPTQKCIKKFRYKIIHATLPCYKMLYECITFSKGRTAGQSEKIADAYLEPSQTTKMELFCENSKKTSIVNGRLGSKYASELDNVFSCCRNCF